MSVRTRGTPGLITLLATLGCAAPAPQAQPVDPDVHREELMEADRAFNAATAARGADGWVSFFAAAL